MEVTDHKLLDLSIVIITLNEEHRLPACLGSLPRGVEIIVLDSGSQDRTMAIAERAGARVAQRPFTNYAEQKNAALAMATRRWVLSLDADEIVDDRLRASIEGICGHRRDQTGQDHAGYRVRRRLVFMGRRLRFGKASDQPLRLFLREKGRFHKAIHEEVQLEGTVAHGTVPGELLHYSYDDLSDYFRRFNNYTTKIAQAHRERGQPMPWGLIHWLRPWTEFFLRYVVRLGFLDGYPGYCYALFSSVYTFVKYAKLREILEKDR